MKNNGNTGKTSDTVTTLGFVMLLTGLLILSMIIPDKGKSENENKELQKLPEFKVSKVLTGAYMREFETYASDNIAVRESWVGLKNLMDVGAGKKDNGSAYFGKDGYLFPIEKIDEVQLEKNLEYTEKFIERVKNIDESIKISVLIAPTAEEIMKEKLPNHAQGAGQQKVLSAGKTRFENMFINPCEILREHDGEYIYYRTDHHWTGLGAYYAYTLWSEQNGTKPIAKDEFKIDVVSRDFYGTTYSKAVGFKTEPDYIEAFFNDGVNNSNMRVETATEIKEMEGLYDESYLKTKDKYSYFLSGNNPLTIIETEKKNKKNLLVIKDSYANCFIPFMTGHFERIYAADLRYYKEDLTRLIREEGITDVLVLYNAVQYSKDRNLIYLLNGEDR